MTEQRVRHILGISGGKDSAALAVFMRQHYPDLPIEYFFCDTGKELKETYTFLDRIEARLGIRIVRLQAERGFDHWLEVYRGVLPSPRMRWCTKQMKIAPLEEFIGGDHAISYVGIRADEDRDGYISTKPNIQARFPFKEHGLVKADIVRLLEDSGIGIPDYYRWRSRSGCSFCFFQRKIEWVRLHDEHPELFWEAVRYEEQDQHDDQNTRAQNYTWSSGETLRALLARREEIEAEHARSEARKRSLPLINAPLAQVLGGASDEDDADGCIVCHI